MPSVSEMLPSRFLKQSDIEQPTVVTIGSLSKEVLDDQAKWTLNFHELDKPLVLNTTNIQALARICGSSNSDNWAGKKAVLFVDENVSYGGKVVGGLRIRAVNRRAAQKPAEFEESEVADYDDSKPTF